MLNDLPDCITHSSCLMFADDFKMFKTVETQQDSIHLQQDINSVCMWFKDNKMTLNITKCCVITYTRRVNYIMSSYTIEEGELCRKKECKDLGVIFQSNLKFNNHYNYIVNKAYKMLGFVVRNSRFFKDLGCIIKLYNSLVRPHLEYASVIWSPQGGVNIDLIEKVQKRFLRYLYVRKNNAYPYMVSYMSMLKSFHLITLERRRSLQAVLFIFSIVNNLKYKDLLIINSIKFLVPK